MDGPNYIKGILVWFEDVRLAWKLWFNDVVMSGLDRHTCGATGARSFITLICRYLDQLPRLWYHAYRPDKETITYVFQDVVRPIYQVWTLKFYPGRETTTVLHQAAIATRPMNLLRFTAGTVPGSRVY